MQHTDVVITSTSCLHTIMITHLYICLKNPALSARFINQTRVSQAILACVMSEVHAADFPHIESGANTRCYSYTLFCTKYLQCNTHTHTNSFL